MKNVDVSEALVRMAQQGDKEAIEQLCRSSMQTVYFIALEVLQNEADAEDIMADTMVTIIEKLKDLKEPKAYVSWVNRIAVNKCKNFLAKNKPVYLGEDESEVMENAELENYREEFLPEEFALSKEKREALMDIIREKTTQAEMMSVLMFYYNGDSIKTIAESMDCAEITVKTRLASARKKIKEGIEERFGKGVTLLATTGFLVLGKAMSAEAASLPVPESVANTAVVAASKAADYGGRTGTATDRKGEGNADMRKSPKGFGSRPGNIISKSAASQATIAKAATKVNIGMKLAVGIGVLTVVGIVGISTLNKKTDEPISSEIETEKIVSGPYEEYVMESMMGTTLSIKVPEAFLIYGEDTISYQSDQVIYLALNVNDGTDAEIKERLSVTLYEENGSIPSTQSMYEYVIETQKDRYDFELIKEKDNNNIHTLWIEAVDPDSNLKERSNKMRMVANFVDFGDDVVCCVLECDYRLKEHEAIVSFEEFEMVADSVVFEIMEPISTETNTPTPPIEPTAPCTATESPATVSPTPTAPIQTAVPLENTAMPEIAYEKDDWRSAGFYIDGKYGSLPMTYDELEQLGFGELKFSTISIEDTDDTDITHIEPLKSYKYGDLHAYNESGEELRVSLVNESTAAQHVKDCTIYAISFTRPDHEIRSGEDVELCNGLTWGDSYESVVSLMGEPHKEISFTNEYGYGGELYYYLKESDRVDRVELHFFGNELDGIYISANPIN